MTLRPPTKVKKGKIPYVFIIGGALMLAVAAGLLLRAPSPVSATPTFLGLAESHYSFIVGTRIDTCALCHTSSIPSLNPYGQAFLTNGASTAAFTAIENMDSDGDGFTNIQELRALTFPGDANDHPTASTATPTRTSTSVPTNTPTRTPTNVPTTVPSNTPTSTSTNVSTNTPTGVPTNTPTAIPSNTPTGVPTGVPTVIPSMTSTLVPTSVGTIIVPTETEEPSLTPIPSGTVIPTPPVQCTLDDERNEHLKKHHGETDEQASAQEEANERRICKNHEDEGSEISEAHEGSQGNQGDVDDRGQQGGDEQGDNGQRGGNNNQNDNGQQGNLGNDQSFTDFIRLWLSQWNVAMRFHG